MKTFSIVWVGVLLQNQLITCSWIVISSTTFDNMFRYWIDFSLVYHSSVPDHFMEFGFVSGGSKMWRSCIYVIWFSCVWVIWKECNNRIFSQKKYSIHNLVDKVKLLSYWWLRAKYINLVFGYHCWWLIVCSLVWKLVNNHFSFFILFRLVWVISCSFLVHLLLWGMLIIVNIFSC